MINNLIKEKKSYYQSYLAHKFLPTAEEKLPMKDEPFVDVWKEYLKQSKNDGVFDTLQAKLVQFQFPIKESISKTETYRNATLKGRFDRKARYQNGLRLQEPQAVQMALLFGPVGGVPVLEVPNRHDFVAIVRALAHKNEPAPIPKTMGAVLLQGLNNWDRIDALKSRWLLNHTTTSWKEEFIRNILPQKNNYQDTLMVLSTKEYSGISHKQIGLQRTDWVQQSLQIRKYHEYCHYFTLRYFGKMSGNIYDEILADYLGLAMTYGFFDHNLFLHFHGLQKYPVYYPGSRLENYVDTAKLSNTEFNKLLGFCWNASATIAAFDKTLGPTFDFLDRVYRLAALCFFDLEQLAAKETFSKALRTYRTLRNKQQPIA